MSDLFEPKPERREIVIHVPGEVRGKNDPRSRVVSGTKADGTAYNFVHHYTDSKTRNYESKIGNYAMQAKGAAKWAMSDKPIQLKIIALFNIPKSKSKKQKALMAGAGHTQKPDTDNIQKCVGDGMRGIILVDDKQIWDARVIKRYVKEGESEGLYIRVIECGEPSSA